MLPLSDHPCISVWHPVLRQSSPMTWPCRGSKNCSSRALLELFLVGIWTLLCVNHETCRSCCSFTSSPSSFFRRTHNVGNGAARSRSLHGAHRQEYNQNDHSDRDEGSIIGGWSFIFSDVLKKLGKNRATEPLIAGRPSLSSWCAEFVDAANRV